MTALALAVPMSSLSSSNMRWMATATPAATTGSSTPSLYAGIPEYAQPHNLAPGVLPFYSIRISPKYGGPVSSSQKIIAELKSNPLQTKQQLYAKLGPSGDATFPSMNKLGMNYSASLPPHTPNTCIHR
jgi:hypothetical protein